MTNEQHDAEFEPVMDWHRGGAAHAISPSLWLCRIETDGNGGLREIPIRPCTRAECGVVAARIVADAVEPTTYERAGPVSDLGERIMSIIRRDGSTTRPGIEAETGCSLAQAFAALGRLRDAGKVELRGHGPSARYVARS